MFFPAGEQQVLSIFKTQHEGLRYPVFNAAGNRERLVFAACGADQYRRRPRLHHAGTEAHVEAQTSLSVKATLDLTLEGSASAELKGGTLAKVNAALVQIN